MTLPAMPPLEDPVLIEKAARLLTPQVSAQPASSSESTGAPGDTGGAGRGATDVVRGSAAAAAPKSKKAS